MIPHPFFLDRIVADRRQALIEQANSRRLLDQRAAPSKRRRSPALSQRLTRVRELLPTRADTPSAAPTAAPVASPHAAVPLRPADR
jgi:hypothetical protein